MNATGDVIGGAGRGTARVGISGWTYAPWRGVFYPKGLPHRAELGYVADHMPSLEINGTFYALQRPDSFRAWYAATPAEFVFSVKGPRFITHMKKLRDVDAPIANFFASGLLALRDKLGPVLWQLPPTFGYDPQRLAAFFERLPRSTSEAAEVAKGHDERLEGRSLTVADADRPLRHALEVRHHSFETPGFLELLREHRIAVVVADTAGKWPLIKDVTADFAYVRLHGDEVLYTSGYSEESLRQWAAQIRAWTAQGRDAYVYFDNDVKVHAPFDAIRLGELLTPRTPPTAASR